jgi:hypothetical protein
MSLKELIAAAFCVYSVVLKVGLFGVSRRVSSIAGVNCGGRVLSLVPSNRVRLKRTCLGSCKSPSHFSKTTPTSQDSNLVELLDQSVAKLHANT